MEKNNSIHEKSEREIVRRQMMKAREAARRSRIQLSQAIDEHKNKVIDGSAA